MNKNSLRGSLLLLLGAAIWGAAFVAQRVGMDHLGPLSFNGIRMLMAGFLLLPVIRIADRFKSPASSGKRAKTKPALEPGLQKKQWIAGLLCGVLLFVSSTLQQIGLVYTTAGKAGFITALYVVLVPLAGWILFRKDPGRWIWSSVLLAIIGLFLLCIPAELNLALNRGDLFVLLCAFCFTGHILVVDHFSPLVDNLRLSCTQFFVCGILSLLPAFFLETISLQGIRKALIPLLYAGVLSGAVAYTLQIIAQKNTNPTVASLMMCLESVFAVLTGALILGERMSLRETAGCIIMFTAVVLAQLSPLLKKKHVRSVDFPFRN